MQHGMENTTEEEHFPIRSIQNRLKAQYAAFDISTFWPPPLTSTLSAPGKESSQVGNSCGLPSVIGSGMTKIQQGKHPIKKSPFQPFDIYNIICIIVLDPQDPNPTRYLSYQYDIINPLPCAILTNNWKYSRTRFSVRAAAPSMCLDTVVGMVVGAPRFSEKEKRKR